MSDRLLRAYSAVYVRLWGPVQTCLPALPRLLEGALKIAYRIVRDL